MADKKLKVGLSLSGGGYRAAAFHLGTLRALHALGVLDKVNVLSTISGGSILGAAYCLQEEPYEVFEKRMIHALREKNVIRRVLRSFTFFKTVLFCLLFLVPAIWALFTDYAWIFLPIMALFLFLLLRFQFYIFPVSKEVERGYDAFFYGNACLSQFRAVPELVIGSTNMETGRPFIFTKEFMGDSYYTYMKPPVRFLHQYFPVSRAVMASSCVPFAFTPVLIDKRFFKDTDQYGKVEPTLVDGGVYDNQGLHRLVHGRSGECGIVVVSDAGGGIFGKGLYQNTVKVLIRTVDVFMNRIKMAQMVQDVYENAKDAKKEIAYFSLGWRAENCISGFVDNMADGNITETVLDAHEIPEAWRKDPKTYGREIVSFLEQRIGYHTIPLPTDEEFDLARSTGTNLTCFKQERIAALMKQAYTLCMIQVKLYTPSFKNDLP